MLWDEKSTLLRYEYATKIFEDDILTKTVEQQVAVQKSS